MKMSNARDIVFGLLFPVLGWVCIRPIFLIPDFCYLVVVGLFAAINRNPRGKAALAIVSHSRGITEGVTTRIASIGTSFSIV